MSIDADYLLSRLPAFYRERDAALGGPLRALLEVIAAQGAVLEADIQRLYDNWFIETCDDWLIPYIGDLLGVRGLYAVSGTQSFGQRALVANTLRLRRRKGTVPVLEQLALDSSGWRARAVEFFELLGATQHVNHRRLHSLRTPDLRDAARLERIDGPFDRSAHSADVRHPPAGLYNIANVGIFLWRLQAYPVQRSRACAVPGMDGCYSFDPLGRGFVDDPLLRDGLLVNRPRTEDEVTHLAQPINVPEPLSRRTLHDELGALRQALADGATPQLLYFARQDEYEPVLRIWLDGIEVPAEHLVVCNLSPIPGVSPEAWQRPPTFLDVSPRGGGAPRRFPPAPPQFLVGFDPLLGRISLPEGKGAASVEVSWAYAFPGDVGGGPYDRRPASAEDDARQGLVDPTGFQLIEVPTDFPDIDQALQAVVPGTRCLVRLLGDSTETLSTSLDLPSTELVIEAANQRRPVLRGDLSLKGNGNTRLVLSGLLLEGTLRLQGDLRALDLRHCSLLGGVHHEQKAKGRLLAVNLTHCLSGPLRSEGALGEVSARYCVFDAAGGEALALPDTPLRLERCSVFGRTRSGTLEASDSLFSEPLLITRRQQGCVRFCYVPTTSKTPRRYRCQPDLVVRNLPAAKAKLERIRVTPTFTSTRLGHPAYAQLRLSCAVEIRTGAEDGAEMGVWNLLQQPQREANLRQALDEYLRFGLEAGVIFVN